MTAKANANDMATKDAAPFDALVADAQQDAGVRPDRAKTGKADKTSKAGETDRPEKAEARPVEKDADGKTPAEDTAQAVLAAPTPEKAAEKIVGPTGDAPQGTLQPTGDTFQPDALAAQAAQISQAAPTTQSEKAKLALATVTGPAAAAETPLADGTVPGATEKTNSVQPSEQRSQIPEAMPGETAGFVKALDDQTLNGQAPNDQAQHEQQDGTPAHKAENPDVRPADGKAADLKSVMDTARAEMAPDAAPRPQAPAPSTNMASTGLVGLEAGTPARTAAPAIAQQVQVTTQAQAAPDLPKLAVDITARSQAGSRQFDIRLDPPELGRVEVRLSIDHDGKTSAHLTAEQPRTLDLLQKDALLLTRALRDAGLDVSQDNLNFSLRQQAQDGGQHMAGQDRHGRSPRGQSLSASRSIEATTTSAAWRAPSDGRLDIRV